MKFDPLSDIILSREEIERLSGGYKRAAEQLRELHRLGFFRARRSRVTGDVIVERAHVEAVAAGRVAVPAGAERNCPQVRQPKLRDVTRISAKTSRK